MKTILIIGSSGGLGKEISSYFNKHDYNLALHYFKNKPEKINERCKLYQADITDENQIQSLVNDVVKDFGRIDVLINNAGVSTSEMSWKTELSNWNNTLAVNLTGPFLVSKHVLPFMRQQNSGRIIFMSSVVAQMGFIGTSAYTASKAALIGLVKTLAKENASKGITINAIAPGYFNAGMINDVTPEIQLELIKQIPVGKLGNPIEIAKLIEYLMDENSSYITGQTISINGGLEM